MKRQILFIHRWLGIVFGVFISIICFSGAVLVFQDELNRMANRISVPDGATMLSPDDLVEAVNQWKTDDLTFVALQMPSEDGVVAEAQFAELGRQTIAVNPYTGERLGESGSSVVRFVKKLHRWLLMPPADTHGGMSVGRFIVGTSAMVMTLILLTGIILWWPKSKKMLMNRLSVKTSKGFRRFAYDSHVSLGIYALLFLLMMSLTGPIFSFQWYRSTATALGGGEQQELFKHDRQGHPDKKDLQMKPQQVTVMQTGQNAQMPQGKLPLQIVFNQLHTGSIGGLLLRILYFLAAIIGGLLPWSGYYMWWKRTYVRKKSSSII